MNRFAGTVQKKIGLLISVVGIGVVVLNTIYLSAREPSVLVVIANPAVWFVLLSTIPFIISIFLESTILKYLQIFTFFAMGVANILQTYNQFYGPGMFFAAWIVMRHYGFLEKHTVLKHATILIILILMSQISAYVHIGPERGIYAGFSTLAYTAFLVYLIVIIWRDMVRQQKLLQTENTQLQTNYNTLYDQIQELEANHKPYNLKQAEISPAEERVIEVLTRYRASNREIAERLNIAESTVKLHLYNIYNKIGVDNRFDVIELCKYNYKEA